MSDHIHVPGDPRIFVFGSNLKGIHGAGAARYAFEKLGAVWGRGEGQMGRAYALPTCRTPGVPVSLELLKRYVDTFSGWAIGSPSRFFVSEVGCGLAGFTAEQVAPLFANVPSNCDLPPGWRNIASIHNLRLTP